VGGCRRRPSCGRCGPRPPSSWCPAPTPHPSPRPLPAAGRDGGSSRMQHQSDVPVPASQRSGDHSRGQIHPQIQRRRDRGGRGKCPGSLASPPAARRSPAHQRPRHSGNIPATPPDIPAGLSSRVGRTREPSSLALPSLPLRVEGRLGTAGRALGGWSGGGRRGRAGIRHCSRGGGPGGPIVPHIRHRVGSVALKPGCPGSP
jgi:hypothetical protein